MKDMNSTIRRNEGTINRNQHKIRKLDGVYKKSYMNELKQDSNTLWSIFDGKTSKLPPEERTATCCNHDQNDPQNKKKKKNNFEDTGFGEGGGRHIPKSRG